jgi:hypothetical protein
MLRILSDKRAMEGTRNLHFPVTRPEVRVVHFMGPNWSHVLVNGRLLCRSFSVTRMSKIGVFFPEDCYLVGHNTM